MAKAKKQRARSEPISNSISAQDKYEWLENPSDPKVTAWVKDQDKTARDFLGKIKDRKDLKSAFEALTNGESRGSISPVASKNSSTGYRYFQYKRSPGQNFSVLYYSDTINSQQKVAIDQNKFSTDGSSSMSWYVPSKDGSLVAYAVSESGSDRVSIRVVDLDNGKALQDNIPPVRYASLAWAPDKSGFFYTKWPDPNVKADAGSHHVYFHKLGTDAKDDVGVFGNRLGSENYTGVGTSGDGKYLFIEVLNHSSGKVSLYYKDMEKDTPITSFAKYFSSSLSIIDIKNDQIYAVSHSGAGNGNVVIIDMNSPQKSNWKELVPETNDILVSAGLIGGKIVLSYMKDAHSVLKVHSTSGQLENEIKLPVIGTVSDITGDPSGSKVFFTFSSFNFYPTNYVYDTATGQLDFASGKKANPELKDIDVKQVWYKSKDGTPISMFLVHKKGMKLDGKNPTVLYGYGGFGINLTPEFHVSIMPFIQDGGVYAMPNLRGGGEYGRLWHGAGMRSNKQNVFDDFIGAAEALSQSKPGTSSANAASDLNAAAEWLIENGYTRKEKLAISGGSNGGLLVATCMVQKPDLYSAVICSVPVLDMLKYPKFGGGVLWLGEYGDPSDPLAHLYLSKYSPYHNVQGGQKYPPVLFMSSDNDTRVDPMHARKMAALMQDNTPAGVVLIRTEEKSGHGFGLPLAKIIEELADQWAFIYNFLDVKNRRTVPIRKGGS